MYVPSVQAASSGPSASVPALVTGLEADGFAVDLIESPVSIKNFIGFIKKISLCIFKNRSVLWMNGLWCPWILITLGLFSLLNRQVILTPRGCLLPSACAKGRSYLKRNIIKFYLKLLAQRTVYFHVTSASEGSFLCELFGPNVRYTEAGNFPVLEKKSYQTLIARDRRVRKICYLGRLSEEKNVETLLEAWIGSIGACPVGRYFFQLLIIGPIDNQYGEELLRRFGREPNIFFLGEITGDAKYEVLSDCDAGVLVSHGENFGVVIEEYLKFGLRVLISHAVPWSIVEAFRVGHLVSTDVESISLGLREIGEHIVGDSLVARTELCTSVIEQKFDDQDLSRKYRTVIESARLFRDSIA